MTNLQAHDDLQARIWADDRMAPGAREAALAMAWVLHHRESPDSFDWKRLRMMLGRDMHGNWRVHDLIAGDAPKYEMPLAARVGYDGECEGPRLRPYRPRQAPVRCIVSEHHPHRGDCRYPVVHVHPDWQPPPEPDDRMCGAHATLRIEERSMVTGWVDTVHCFCSRHKGRAAEVRAMLAARGEPPEPIPNSGGTLPRYFPADWTAIYARAVEKSWRTPFWKPPYHGCDADDWPVPGKTAIPRRPRLALIVAS
jgi:hypothetical protein